MEPLEFVSSSDNQWEVKETNTRSSLNFSETSALPHNSTQCHHTHQKWAKKIPNTTRSTDEPNVTRTEYCRAKSVARILVASRQEERTASTVGQLDYTTVLLSLSSDGVRSLLKTIHTVFVFPNKRTLSDLSCIKSLGHFWYHRAVRWYVLTDCLDF